MIILIFYQQLWNGYLLDGLGTDIYKIDLESYRTISK